MPLQPGLTSGSEPPPWTFGPLTRTDIVRYQGASGDMNPVHHDEPFAQAAGFPAPLGVGMLTAGLMTTWATRWLGAEHVRRTRFRWKKPVFPGSTITVSGRVTGVDGAVVSLELSATDEVGAELVQGWMTFDLSGAAE